MNNNWTFLLLLVAAAAFFERSSAQEQEQPPLDLGGGGGNTASGVTTPTVTTTAAPAAPADTGNSSSTPVPAEAATPTGAPVEAWGGCVDPSQPNAPLKVGKKTTICVVLASSTDWSTPPVRLLRLSFQPEADEYSWFHVPSSYQDLIQNQQISALYNGNNNVTIHVASQQQLSFQRMFFNPTAGRLYPHLTAIIDVSKGRVKGITWDDACLFCGSDKCEENTYDFNGNLGTRGQYKQPTKGCYLEQAQCQEAVSANSNEDPPCDIKVHVVWTGDDADGRAFQSSAFRFSAFPPQELRNRVDLPEIPDLPFSGGDEEEAQPQEEQPQGAA